MTQAAQRNRRFAVGLALTFLPIVLWIALPAALFVRLAALGRVDERLVEAYSFVAGALFQLAAIYFLENARQKPRDILSIFAIAVGSVSAISVFVFFGAATAVVLQGW